MTIWPRIRRGLARFGLARRKAVVLTGMFAPLNEIIRGAEVWGCNRSYIWNTDDPEVWGVDDPARVAGDEHRQKIDRQFFFDDVEQTLEATHPKHIQYLAALDIPVTTKVHYPDIPKSEAFRLREIMTEFKMLPQQLVDKKRALTINEMAKYGAAYFTSTVAYMMAEAIYRGYDDIVIHRLMVLPHSLEYFEQRSCLNYWAGIAVGRGIRLVISDDSHIAKPSPWEPMLYGYIKTEVVNVTEWLFADATAAALKYPHRFHFCDDVPKEVLIAEDEDSVLDDMYIEPQTFHEIKKEDVASVH